MNVLVIAAHPDDEALGAGVAIARHARMGDAVTVMFMTEGTAARDGATGAESARRRAAAEKAGKILGVSDLRFHDFPDNAMDRIALLDIVKAVERVASDIRPEIVYLHHPSDLNIDHKIAARAAITCFRPLPGQSAVRLLSFEAPSATGWDFGDGMFAPNVFLDARYLIETKMKAIEAYDEELRPFPHVRSREAIRARATYWGTQTGLEAAEPFELVRELVR
ncbi:MAG TPA: PIG-L deacetylase family protein [Rhizomicrobium sp.]|nr:PIG-L deacetylase family protein [Rhizomicrobium sp.]